MMTPTEKALLKSLLKNAIFAIDRNCEVKGRASLSREDDNILVLAFTVSDDPQPLNDVFGEPSPIVMRLTLDSVEPHPFGPELHFADRKTAAARTAKHTYHCINIRLDGAPEIYLTR